MTHEEIKKLEESFDRYKKALALVYADGDVTSVERNRLISLKNELGLSDSDCMVMEARFHETADQDGIKWEELKDRHHCHLCDSDGKIRWNGIDHSMLEYIELGDTYIEASNGSSYTGLREPFVLSIGQSFEELLDEYGENHIYDAIKDGRLQVFDEQKDLETFLKLKFDILDQEEMEKKIKGIVSDSQVLENPMLEHGSSPKNNIQQPFPVVNSKMSDREMKYSSLSAEKLISFISDEAFTKEMAAFTLADFEGNGTPLVIDELGNVCEKTIWESKEENAIVDYMPSGILTKEIEIIEDFLTGHTDIPAKQRVEVLKLKDSLEEINDRLIIKEEKSEEQERRSSRSDKEIVKDYLDRIKDNLPPSDRNIVDEVMKASSKVLADFTAEEKKVIGKYLMENGAKDQKSLGNLLKKKVEPEHNHETNRDIERGR